TLEAPKSARLVIVRALQGDAAILVDKVDEVIRLPFSALESPPPGWGDRDGVSALARKGDALWAVLDVEQVVS
ncbi:MAG TPA: chemotaxis protein CheW, partial [Myxococcaceae bacterium]|nr:chemotaxis protein CheW [Myxococcaceae bacterium]